ncbi:hypothetical protein [Mediterraneibacter agrestimuris]|uniref:hypothetical protein n=1 Tax=Mediterraneibacter agrestimuris TaxID=2941333 RepID=UPI0020417BE0|nr:hypothetical protein [Mediterraneibacter agrestimuris]
MNRTEYKNQHAKEHYDRINFKIPIGEKARIRAAGASIVKRPPRFAGESTVLQGGLTSHFYGMGVMPMKNHFDFKDIMTFGLFLLALLTFVFTFCK